MTHSCGEGEKKEVDHGTVPRAGLRNGAQDEVRPSGVDSVVLTSTEQGGTRVSQQHPNTSAGAV